MNDTRLSDNKAFRCFCICLFSAVIYIGLASVGGIIALIPLLICIFSGLAAGLICYVEYNQWKND